MGKGFVVETEEQLERALLAAQRQTGSFSLLHVHLDPLDRSPAMERLAERLAKNIQAGGDPLALS